MKKCWVLSVFSVVFSLLLGLLPANSVHAENVFASSISGRADKGWFGLANALSASNNDYVYMSDWIDTDTLVNFDPHQTWGLKRIVAVAGINITQDMIHDNKLTFQGAVRIGFHVQSNHELYENLPSSFRLFDGNSFKIGIDKNFGVFDADTRVTSANCSRYAGSTKPLNYANFSCEINFTASYSYWDTPGAYNLNWYLNGNNNTNGGIGSQWGGFSGIGASSISYINTANMTTATNSYAIDFVDPSSSTTPSDSPDYTQKLDQLASQNNTMIGQNNQIIDGIGQMKDQMHEDNQAMLDEQKKQTEAINETKDFITDTSEPDSSDIATSDSLPSVGLLPPGPVDSILLLPVNIMNSILSSLGGSCSPIVAPLPFVGENITFPCFGDTIYNGDFAPLANIIGVVASAFILYGYLKHLYKKVDRATSLETNDEDEWGVL